MKLDQPTASRILNDEEILRRRDKDSFDAGFKAGIEFAQKLNPDLIAKLKRLSAQGYAVWSTTQEAIRKAEGR